MKRKSTIKKTPVKKKFKEDKNQRSLEFYFNKQSKTINDTSPKRLEKSLIKHKNNSNIEQNEACGLTNAVTEDNLSIESIADNASVKESSVTTERPEAMITSDTSQNFKKYWLVFNKTASITSASTIQSNNVTLSSNTTVTSSSELS